MRVRNGNCSILKAKIYVLRNYKILNQMPILRKIILQCKNQEKMHLSYGIQIIMKERSFNFNQRTYTKRQWD